MAFEKHTVITYPRARSERLVVQSVGDETVVYDEETKAAHALKSLAAAVFMYADGKNSVGDIAELAGYRLGTPVSENDVQQAIEELSACALLEAPEGLLERGISRRAALKSFAVAGAGTMLVTSVAAPLAAASPTSTCGSNYTCGSGDSGVRGGAQTWPQPWTSSGGLVAPFAAGGPYTGSEASSSYELGADCCVNASSTCTYTYTDNAGTKHTVSAACVTPSEISSSEVCALGKNASVGGTSVGSGGAIVTGVSSSLCGEGGGHAFCATKTSNNLYAYAGSTSGKGTCSSGQTLITPNSSDVTLVASQVSGSCTEGTYMCVPCDGPRYQCCEAVCVPVGTTPDCAIASGYAVNDTNGQGYGAYTDLAYTGINYPYKFCKPCTVNDTCS